MLINLCDYYNTGGLPRSLHDLVVGDPAGAPTASWGVLQERPRPPGESCRPPREPPRPRGESCRGAHGLLGSHAGAPTASWGVLQASPGASTTSWGILQERPRPPGESCRSAHGLEHHQGETDAGAVDVTDDSAFDWPRWLAKIRGAQTVIWNGIYRVYAVRWQPHGDPEVAFCYDNQTYSTLTPRNAVYTPSTRETSFVYDRSRDWTKDTLLSEAPKASVFCTHSVLCTLVLCTLYSVL